MAIQGPFQGQPPRQTWKDGVSHRLLEARHAGRVRRVGHGAMDHPEIVEEQREGAQRVRRRRVDEVEGLLLRSDVLQIDRVVAELLREGGDDLPLTDTGVNQQLADPALVAALTTDGGAYGRRSRRTPAHQHLPEGDGRLDSGRVEWVGDLRAAAKSGHHGGHAPISTTVPPLRADRQDRGFPGFPNPPERPGAVVLDRAPPVAEPATPP